MRVELVSASAGTGKTRRLCEEVVRALTAPMAERARIEGIVAITYTRKAEAELRTRIRRALIVQGLIADAQRLPLAYCGTVHAVCLRLLGEHALVAGLPPELDVLPDDDADLELARALEKALDPATRSRFDEICARVQPNWDGRVQKYNWTVDAQDLIELARSNRVTPARLLGMARRSADSLLALLPQARHDGDALDGQLVSEIARAITAIENLQDTTQKTHDALDVLHDTQRRLQAGATLSWSSWLALTKLTPAKKALPLLADVARIAEQHREHPRFHADLRGYITTLYELVACGLDDYARWKQARRLIDYVDMEERALNLLERAEVAEQLRERLDLVVIDEFQDTSPIQLELFLRLESLAKRSIWVGDRKQSIFAFRGADPALMDSVVQAVEKSGRTIDVLGMNHRSRPALVDFVSNLFAPALVRQGYRDEHVRVKAQRSDEKLATLAPIGCWWLESVNQPQDALAIARGVARLLSDAERTPIEDRETGIVRAARANDVAILAATNDEANRIADALHSLGIASAVARGGLLQTPEGTLLSAAIRLAIDSWDHAAAAELDALGGYDGRAPDDWLTERIRAYAQERGRPAARGLALRIEELRAELVALSPVEAVERLIGALDLCTLCCRWPRPAQRLANLDAFTALARQYEHHCAYAREAASLSGFLQFLAWRGADEADAQLAPAEDSVQVCTYHRSKGLEWPIVILAGLDSSSRAYGVTPDAARARLERGQHHRVFGAAPESDAAEFDARAPLAGRWLRMWPWPYTAHQAASLRNSAAQTAEADRVLERETGESLRLLYVGFTRARDHLVLTARLDKKTGAPKAAWLDAINDGNARLLLLPDGTQVQPRVSIAGTTHAFDARVWKLNAQATDGARQLATVPAIDFGAPAPGDTLAKPFRINPSQARSQWPTLPTARVERIHRIGGRVAFDVTPADQADAGSAVHDFLAADRPELAPAERVARAAALIALRAMPALHAEELVAAADAFRAFVDASWPGAVWHRELPVTAMLEGATGQQRIDGRIDLLLETQSGWIVVDHKTFPGGEATWAAHAIEHAPQLAAYRQVLLTQGSLPVLACLIHFPIAGGVVELAFDSDARATPRLSPE